MSNPFYEAIARRANAAVIPGSESQTDKQLRFMVRVPAGPTTTVWLGLIRTLLVAAKQGQRKANWTLDISKHYFATADGDLRYGWRLIIQCNLIEVALADLADIISSAPVQASQIEEVRLNGSPNRRVGGLMGHVSVGAAA